MICYPKLITGCKSSGPPEDMRGTWWGPNLKPEATSVTKTWVSYFPVLHCRRISAPDRTKTVKVSDICILDKFLIKTRTGPEFLPLKFLVKSPLAKSGLGCCIKLHFPGRPSLTAGTGRRQYRQTWRRADLFLSFAWKYLCRWTIAYLDPVDTEIWFL